MDREILSKLPTLLRHKLQSKMAHFAVLWRRSPLLGDMEFFGAHQNENQINADGS